MKKMKMSTRQITQLVAEEFGLNIIYVGRYPHGYLFCHDRSKRIWCEVSGIVERFLRGKLPSELLSIQVIKEVMADICQFFYTEIAPEEPPWNLINLTNGIWDIKAGKFIEFGEDDKLPFFLSHIPHEFHPDSKDNADRIDNLFEDWVSAEYKIVLYELAGYCLLRSNFSQKFFNLYGPGDNGKTTYAELLRKLVGPQNCSSLSMDEIMYDRFAASSLRGKLINISGELVPTLKRTDRIKLLTGGDEVFAQEKFKAGFFFKPYAKLLFMGNTIPSTPDSTPGFYRRTNIIPFLNTIPPEKKDPQLLHRISEQDLKTLLGKIMLEFLPSFIDRGFKLSVDPSVDELSNKWETLSNPLQGFIQEYFCVRPGKSEFIPNFVLSPLYEAYCKQRGIPKLSDREFAVQIKKEEFKAGNRRLPPDKIKEYQEAGFSVSSPCRGWWCNGVTLVTANIPPDI